MGVEDSQREGLQQQGLLDHHLIGGQRVRTNQRLKVS